jgi:L-threonylcarbamoyladenylate synthase
VRADLDGDVDVVLDGGPATVGVESTIVDCSGEHPAILRLGGVTQATVEAIVGAPVALLTRGEVAAPGTLERHYSPSARVVVVDASDVEEHARRARAAGRRVGVLAPAGVTVDTSDVVVLNQPVDAAEYARVLYARLREADERRLDTLIVVPPPPDGIGAAVADRLARAAATGELA